MADNNNSTGSLSKLLQIFIGVASALIVALQGINLSQTTNIAHTEKRLEQAEGQIERNEQRLEETQEEINRAVLANQAKSMAELSEITDHIEEINKRLIEMQEREQRRHRVAADY